MCLHIRTDPSGSLMDFPGGPVVKNFFASTGEKAMAPHSSTLAWKILWTEEPGRLQSMAL